MKKIFFTGLLLSLMACGEDPTNKAAESNTNNIAETTETLDLPLQCTENPDDWGVAQQYASEEQKQQVSTFERKSIEQWNKLQKIVITDEFKKYGMNSDVFKKWQVAQNEIIEQMKTQLPFSKFKMTDYFQCREALNYSLVFQADFARGVALDTRPKHYKNEVEKQFLLLKKRQ